jgi:hypothetical protein
METALARRLCRTCPVREPCLHYALDHHVEGVWGGLDEAERRQLRAADEQALDADVAGGVSVAFGRGPTGRRLPAGVAPERRPAAG